MEVTAKERVQDELCELKQRIKRLIEKLFDENISNEFQLYDTQRKLLERQLSTMLDYARILTERLANWEN